MLFSIIFVFFLIVISFGIGNRIVNFQKTLEKFVFSTAIGLGIISYLTLFLALIGILYKWTCLLLLLSLIPIAIKGLWKEWKIISSDVKKIRSLFPLKRQNTFEYILLFALLISIILCLIISLAPPTDYDSLVYHLSIPKIWIQNHRAIYIPFFISEKVYQRYCYIVINIQYYSIILRIRRR